MSKEMTMTDQKQLSRDIIKAFKTKVIHHPAYCAVLEAIENTHAMSGIEGTGMLLLGTPGVGKTTSLEKYIERYMVIYGETESDTKTSYPIVKISIPSKPTIKGVIIKILNAVEHPDLTGSQAQLEVRLSRFIKTQDVEMLIFDECQHLLKEQAQISTRNVVNFIKTLMDDHQLAVIMAGIPEAKHSIIQFEELYQRFTAEHIELHPFSTEDTEERQRFCGYLNACRSILESMDVKTIDLATETMQERIELATQGLPRLINRLLVKAITLGDLNKTLNLNDFIQAYSKAQLNRELGLFNPFSAQPAKVSEKLKTLREKMGKRT